jgi:hypothetical protein
MIDGKEPCAEQKPGANSPARRVTTAENGFMIISVGGKMPRNLA